MRTAERYTVYFCYDASDALIYVGVSGQIERRLRRHEKATAWWPEVARVEREHYTTPEAAGQREHTIMHSLAPRHNKDLALAIPKRQPHRVSFEVRLPDELAERLAEEARRADRPMHWVVLALLDEHLWRQETYDNQAEEYREHRRRGLARLAADRDE